jgi:hypothetical protein
MAYHSTTNCGQIQFWVCTLLLYRIQVLVCHIIYLHELSCLPMHGNQWSLQSDMIYNNNICCMCSPRSNSPICKMRKKQEKCTLKSQLTVEQNFNWLGTTKITKERTWKDKLPDIIWRRTPWKWRINRAKGYCQIWLNGIRSRGITNSPRQINKELNGRTKKRNQKQRNTRTIFISTRSLVKTDFSLVRQ